MITTRYILSTIAIISLLSLAACGGGDEPDLTGTWVQEPGCMPGLGDDEKFWMFRYEFKDDGEIMQSIFSTKYIDEQCSTVDPEWFDGTESVTTYQYQLGAEIRPGVYELDRTRISFFTPQETEFIALLLDGDTMSLTIPQTGDDSLFVGEDGTSPETRAVSVSGFSYLKITD